MGRYRRYRQRNALSAREVAFFAAWLMLLWAGLTAMREFGAAAQVIYGIGITVGLKALWIWAGRPEPDQGTDR